MLPAGLEVLPTDAHSWILVKVLRQRELLAQSKSSSEMAFFQWPFHARVQSVPLSPIHQRPHISYPSNAMQDIAEKLLQFQINSWDWLSICCSYIAGQVFPLPCPISLSLWEDCFLKHSLIFLGLHFLQNQAIDRWCQEKESVPKNGILEMNYSLAIDNENPFTGIGVMLIVSGMR